APFAAIYSGNGITNNSTGTFNAALAGVGNHTITLSAQTVCPADFSTTITVNSLPILSLTGDTTICANTDANLIATGAVNYNWSPAALFSNPISGNTSVNIAANTSIQLTGTDINGCSTTEEYNLIVFDPPYLSVESPSELCQGALASLSANASEGLLVWLDSLGNYVSNQNPFVSTANSTNTYTAELTDQCNIILTSTGTIIVENEFGISAGSDTLLCEGLNVGISAITTGQAFTTIEWSTASGSISGATNTADALVSAAGVYTVTALSPLGCQYTDDVTVIEFPNPQLTLTEDTMICASQPFGLISSGADIYSWSSDAGSFDDASIDNPQITISTSASATVIGIDLNGCADTATVYLDVFPVLQNSISPVGEICAGDSVTIIATADPGIYQWIDESGNVLGNLTSLTVAPTSTSTYSFNVEDECSSVVTAEIEVEVENGYNINAGMNTGFCPELSVQITAIANGSGASYEWTTNNGVIGTEVNSLSLLVSDAGTYTITQTSPLGCEYSDNIIIVQYPIPPVNAGADNEVCHGIPYPLNASGAINYSWSPSIGLNNNSIANPSVTITNDASYYLTGIDGNGCVGYDTVQLTVRELPQVSIGEVDMICPESSTLLEATGNYDSFLWAPSSTLNVNNLSIVESTPQTTTQYFVTLTDPECGLTAQASVTVSVESGFSINAGQDISFCEGGSVTTQAIAQGDYDQLQWGSSTGSSFITSNVTDLTTSENGTYIASITSPLGCEYSDAMQVIEITYPQINLPDSIPFCQGEAVNVSVGLGWDAIEWSTGDNSFETSIEYQGLYYVSVYNSFCATHDTFFVYQVQLPWFDLGPNRELCEGDTLTLNAGIDGLWSNGAYGSSIQALQEGTYSFSIEEEGCISFDEVYIDVIELPEYTFISPQYACMGELHTLEPIGAYGAVFEWENGEFGESLTIDAPGNYYVIVSNECGTTAAQVEVIYQDCEGLVFIPNCFTPDGDGINDVWSVSGADILGM
ncbi:MAG: hypothetical protein ACKOW8_06725, partial [Flavobacteriales bacterium]